MRVKVFYMSAELHVKNVNPHQLTITINFDQVIIMMSYRVNKNAFFLFYSTYFTVKLQKLTCDTQ